MSQKTKALLLSGTLGALILSVPFFATVRQSGAQETAPAHVADGDDCSFFTTEREKYATMARERYRRSRLTAEVIDLMATSGIKTERKMLIPSGTRTEQLQDLTSSNSFIDIAILSELQRRNIAPADKTTDFEFARRVSLDLTGRVPTYDRLIAFTANASATKRAEFVNELLASPEWVDKWTMYFGDLFRNTAQSDVTPKFEQGRNAMYYWIRDSLAQNKRYNVMATELIASKSSNTFVDGTGNWLLTSDTNGGPQHDDYDQAAAAVATTFLGIGHMNCILCHNGRGHLDTLSSWGRNAKRSEAYGMAAFFGRMNFAATRPDPANNNLRYYSIVDNGRQDYTLNTTTGNRPARTPVDGLGMTVPPRYPFSGRGVVGSENRRDALAREVTNDFQFARATVNYIWAQFMGRGLVEPLDQFDINRLDPANPPSGNWTIQPSHPELLHQLADEFRRNNYDLKWLMRTIVNSEAYQLSSRYSGEWNPTWEPTFARHLVRRLWAEEIHDAISTTSGLLPTYNISEPTGPTFSTRATRAVQYAMQLPETNNLPDGGGAVSSFLNSFLRGNRLTDDRSGEGNAMQALNLMNDAFVITRIRNSAPNGARSLLNRTIGMADAQLVTQLYLTILSRQPSEEELSLAVRTLTGTTGTTRTQRGENLIWSLYNKVDFIYNY
jgi:hypothetical protein